jgi:hypothetical protein
MPFPAPRSLLRSSGTNDHPNGPMLGFVIPEQDDADDDASASLGHAHTSQARLETLIFPLSADSSSGEGWVDCFTGHVLGGGLELRRKSLRKAFLDLAEAEHWSGMTTTTRAMMKATKTTAHACNIRTCFTRCLSQERPTATRVLSPLREHDELAEDARCTDWRVNGRVALQVFFFFVCI